MNLNNPEPMPRPSTGPDIWELVISDMRERNAHGFQKYGQTLRAGDGRKHLVDAYQECLDMAVYLRQEIEERQRTCPYSPTGLHIFTYRPPYGRKVRENTTCQFCGVLKPVAPPAAVSNNSPSTQFADGSGHTVPCTCPIHCPEKWASNAATYKASQTSGDNS